MPAIHLRSATGLLFALSLLAHTAQGATLWLSDKSPHAGHGGAHAHGGPVQIRRGVYYKQLWLRLGDGPQDSGYVVQGTQFSPLILLDTKGEIKEHEIKRGKQHGMLNVDFAMPDEGFYNAYVSHTWVDQGTRQIQIAKAEVLKHSCREGHDNIQPKMPPKHNSDVALEIVRERLPGENFHTKLGSGDKLSFQLLHYGKPVPKATVTFTSATGWSKQVISDSDGRIHLTMLRDYFPAWPMFNKGQSQPYLLATELALPESGELDGKDYSQTLVKASYAGNYYPSPRDYESYGYGLALGVAALFLSGVGIYFFRRRRSRPYREVRFDE
ncbi:MAG: hypothetical protein P8Z39_05180 [Gammaproteobacteria bacterium]